jgi:hypothetical protein
MSTPQFIKKILAKEYHKYLKEIKTIPPNKMDALPQTLTHLQIKKEHRQCKVLNLKYLGAWKIVFSE